MGDIFNNPTEFIAYLLDHCANYFIGICLMVVIWFYFSNNPMRHSRWFVLRRFINWFPLGMTYAFLYMGRNNLNAVAAAPPIHKKGRTK